MKQRFKLQIELAFDEDGQDRILFLARAEYERSGVVMTRGGNGRPRQVPPAEFIRCIEQALAELAERNPITPITGFARATGSTGWDYIPRPSDGT